ncbi:MAG: sterol desaturase family protein [Bacteroidia bacterium]
MPNLFQLFTDPISLLFIGIYLLLIAAERFFNSRRLTHIPFWWLKGMLSFLVYFIISSYIPLLIEPQMVKFRVMDLSTLSLGLQITIGLLGYELGAWLYHFSIHKNSFLWRTIHQMHHSAERVDTFGAFFFSPMDMVGWTLLGSVVFAWLMGLSAQATTIAMLVTFILAVFQHSNIRTPRWIGYIIQRPESHTYHHARGIHRCNYSDLPIWDMLFGTFKNPKEFPQEAGFYDGASSRVPEMLSFKLVDQPKSN